MAHLEIVGLCMVIFAMAAMHRATWRRCDQLEQRVKQLERE